MPYYVGTLDAHGVEQASRVLGGVGERVAALDLVGQPVPAPGQGEHSVPVAQVRGQLRKDMGSAAQAGQQQQGVAVPAPVQVVEADAVEDDELIEGNVDRTRHSARVPATSHDVDTLLDRAPGLISTDPRTFPTAVERDTARARSEHPLGGALRQHVW